VKALAALRHHRAAPVVLMLLALLLMGGVYATLAPTPASADTASTATDVEEGERLFQANCATCHGPNAEGSAEAPSLVGVGAASVDFQVSTGRMPMQMNGPQAEAKPPQFDKEQTAALSAYVASLGAGPAIPTDEQVDPAQGDPSNGMALFRTNCAMCHNAVGAGGALSEGKFAPPLSTRYTHGKRFSSATCCARRCFFTVSGKYTPPFTVESFATIITSRPATRPIPVIMPAAGASESYMPCALSCQSSRKGEPGSSRRSTRSRGKSLPRATCRSRMRSGPPSAALATVSRSF